MKDYFNAVNEDATASQQFYVVLEEGVTDTKRAEEILRKNRGGFVKDSNGVISTLNPEVLNTYKPSGTGANDWSNITMRISNINQENPSSETFT